MSSTQSRAYHSITFGNRNTWDDWKLIPSSRPNFASPKVKTNYIEIQGRSGILDMTETLTGFPLYNNREGSFEFYVQNETTPWYELKSTISEYLHGQKLQAVLDDDPDWYYEGRFSVDDWNSHNDGKGSTITIQYSVYPYKLANTLTSLTFEVTSSLVANIYNNLDIMPVCPTMRATASGMTMTYTEPNDRMQNTVDLSTINKTYNEVTLYKPSTHGAITFAGTGTVYMSYRNGRL